jgi:hypothetical protein
MRNYRKIMFPLAVAILVAATPVALAQSGRSVAAARPFPIDVQSLATSGGSPSGGGAPLSPGTTGIPGGANWLLTQQDASGAFPWTVGGTLHGNTQGPTALGMLGAYEVDSDPLYLSSAVATGDFLVPTYPDTFTDGDPRFATHNPLFLEELSRVTGDSAYSDFVQTWFWGLLTAGTYGETNDLDAAGFGAYVVAARTSQGYPALSPWDLSATAIAADLAGDTTARDALMGAILAGLEGTTAGDTYDVIGLAGAVWASGRTGVDLDPTAGAYAGANSTADLAVLLSGMTLTADNGAWLLNSTADPTDPANADTQSSAYAIMALVSYDPVTYNAQALAGETFILSLQQGTGQFLAYPGAPTAEPGGVEVHAEALMALDGTQVPVELVSFVVSSTP